MTNLKEEATKSRNLSITTLHRSNQGGREREWESSNFHQRNDGKGAYFVTSLDVLNSDELASNSISHETSHSEVARPDISHEVVPIALVYDRQINRHHRRCRRIHIGD